MPGRLILLASLVLAATVATADVPTLSGYKVSSWSGGDGFTLGAVRALAQDREGYLWLGTGSGLYRFDGVRFSPVETLAAAALPKLPVTALLVDDDGTLWIGLANGGGVFSLRAHRIERSSPVDLVSGTVNGIARDAGGVLWVAHDAGLLRLEPGGWRAADQALGMTADRVLHLHATRRGFYAGTSAGLFLWRPEAGRFEHVPAGGDEPVRGTATDRQGRVWITDATRGFHRLGTSRTEPRPMAGRGSELLADHLGQIWLATVGQGLWRIDEHSGIARVTLQNGLLSDGIWSLLEDREGNIWVGTHEGLNRLSRHVVTPLVDLGITSTISRGVGGTMWAASTDGVIQLTPNGRDQPPVRRVFQVPGVRTVEADAQGTVWVGARTGLLRLTADRQEPLLSPAGTPFARVASITSNSRGMVWFADAAQGLWRWHHGVLRRISLPPPLDATRIRTLQAGHDDALWMALDSGTLAVADRDESVVTYGRDAGLTHDAILGIHDDPRSGLWVVGSNGLSHLEGGRFRTIDKDHGLPVRRFMGVTSDAAGALWLTFSNGIGRLDPAEFARASRHADTRVQFRLLDTSDGLAGMPTNIDTHTTALAEDGRLWFVTGRGLTIVDPGRAFSGPRASGTVRIESALIDDEPVAVTAPMRLPAGAKRVRVDYTALNLTYPERLRFRYRLDGFDGGWQEAGQRRQAFYTNLRPGDYRFRVEVSEADGTWQGAASDWAFSVTPRFYQRPIFYALCGGMLALAVGGAWRLRLRQVQKEFGLVLAERARISREIHDTLLQSMVGVALKIESVSPRTAGHADQLVEVRRDIEDAISEARRTIWNMRAGGAGSPDRDLIAALEDAGARATLNSSIRCRLIVRGTPCRCAPGVVTELLRIAQEALANAVRHAQPSLITMELQFATTSVTLRITDNGRGFEQTTTRSSHFGLLTMRERAEQLGGRLSLTTSGHGTQVEATIPVSSLG